MRLITIEDFRDIYLKTIQRGFPFIMSKFTLNGFNRTKSSFNQMHITSANWWIIDEIHQRWNLKITGSEAEGYEAFVSRTYLSGNPSLKLLSIGSGVCSHEILLATLNPDWEIVCIDFSEQPFTQARAQASSKNLHNIRFITANIYDYTLPEDHYDAVMFHQSLHHFHHLETFIPEKIVKTLKPDGKLMIHEYVGANRLQYPRKQLDAINGCLRIIDRQYRKMFKSNLYKKYFYGSGWLRMLFSDPSECVDSENILPVIHAHFDTVYERSFGGNLLMCALKDISHHFVEMDATKIRILRQIMEYEDKYLETNASDFVFGIYQKR